MILEKLDKIKREATKKEKILTLVAYIFGFIFVLGFALLSTLQVKADVIFEYNGVQFTTDNGSGFTWAFGTTSNAFLGDSYAPWIVERDGEIITSANIWFENRGDLPYHYGRMSVTCYSAHEMDGGQIVDCWNDGNAGTTARYTSEVATISSGLTLFEFSTSTDFILDQSQNYIFSFLQYDHNMTPSSDSVFSLRGNNINPVLDDGAFCYISGSGSPDCRNAIWNFFSLKSGAIVNETYLVGGGGWVPASTTSSNLSPVSTAQLDDFCDDKFPNTGIWNNISNALCRVLLFGFSPSESSYLALQSGVASLEGRFPFSYFFSTISAFDSVSTGDTNAFPEIIVTAPIGASSSVTIINVDQTNFENTFPTSTVETIKTFGTYFVWILFAVFCIYRIRSII